MKKKYQLTAKTANKYDLYEKSVQSVDFEIDFVNKIDGHWDWLRWTKIIKLSYLNIQTQ